VAWRTADRAVGEGGGEEGEGVRVVVGDGVAAGVVGEVPAAARRARPGPVGGRGDGGGIGGGGAVVVVGEAGRHRVRGQSGV
jgi:hypothetical protein